MVCVDERTQSMQLRGFSWILSTIRRGFFEDRNSITELQKKNKKFVWTEKCVEAFERLKELLDLGVICPSMSPWGALVIFIWKKDGSWRLLFTTVKYSLMTF